MESLVNAIKNMPVEVMDSGIPFASVLNLFVVSNAMLEAMGRNKRTVQVLVPPAARDVHRAVRNIEKRCKVTVLRLYRKRDQNTEVGKLAPVLPMLRSLALLDLSHSNIGDKGVQALAAVLPQCRSLIRLDLQDNDIGDEAVGQLAEVLPECPSLANLSFWDNNIGPEGAMRLAAVLPQCQALRVLDLSENAIGVEGVNKLLEVHSECPALCSLILDDTVYVLSTEAASE